MDNNIRVEKCSICRVTGSSIGMEGDIYLERLFDIEDDRLSVPIINEDAPKKFGNRTWLYKNDGPNSIGYIGCWRWSAKTNKNKPESDYVRSTFIQEIRPIFVDSITVQNNEQLISALKNEYRISANERNGNGIILIYKSNSRCYQGVYIPPEKMIEIETGDYILNPDTAYLRTVVIDRADVLPFENEKIYRFLSVNLGGTLLIKSPFEVIKQYFLKNATWKTYSRMVGGTHAEHNELKAFIESINEIAEAFSHTLFSSSCGCLECNEEYSKDVKKCIFDAPDPVICIDGFTNFNWLHSVPDICSCREKTLFFLTPYFEELFLAPKGLVSYVFPISTSEFVEELPTEDYIAGLYNSGQEEVRYAESERKILELNDLGMARTLQKKYQRIYVSAKVIMADRRKNTLMRYMTLLIPYAVLTGTSEKLKPGFPRIHTSLTLTIRPETLGNIEFNCIFTCHLVHSVV